MGDPTTRYLVPYHGFPELVLPAPPLPLPVVEPILPPIPIPEVAIINPLVPIPVLPLPSPDIPAVLPLPLALEPAAPFPLPDPLAPVVLKGFDILLDRCDSLVLSDDRLQKFIQRLQQLYTTYTVTFTTYNAERDQDDGVDFVSLVQQIREFSRSQILQFSPPYLLQLCLPPGLSLLPNITILWSNSLPA